MVDTLARVRQLRAGARPIYGQVDPTTDVEGSLNSFVRDTQNSLNMALQNSPRAEMERQQAENNNIMQNVDYLGQEGQEPQNITGNINQPIVRDQNQQNQQYTAEQIQRSDSLPRVTQAFGNKNPGVEKYSGGVNLGTDFAVKRGTPLGLPPGEWEVVDTFSGAQEGNRGANSGSGNLVKVVNKQTGESLAFEHLSDVRVSRGQTLPGGTVIGKSGNTGNSTGPHASLPYKNSQGQYRDILSTPYANYIFGK